MIRITARKALLIAAILLIASVLITGAFALSIHNTLFSANLNGASFQFNYRPPVNGEYALYLHSQDGGEVSATARLFEDDTLLAEGGGRGELFTCRLTAGHRYTVRVQGTGMAMIEVARRAHSRCVTDPMDIADDYQGGKMIARKFDAHWYRFTARADGSLAIVCIPESEDIAMDGMITDANGTWIAQFDLLGGSGLCTLNVRAGETYCIRLSSPGGGTGYYWLKLFPAEKTDQALKFAKDRYSATAGSVLKIADQITGAPLLWRSDDPEIARVSQAGEVYALRAGTAKIIAYGAHGSAECIVKITFVPLEGIAPVQSEIELAAGGDVRLQLAYTPANASDKRVYYRSDSPCADVDEDGTLHALSEGEASIRASNGEGTVSAVFRVTVTAAPVRYRALLVSQQDYPSSVGAVRGGSEESVRALKSLLSTMCMDADQAYAVRTEYDSSRAEFIAAIRETFERAADQDVSLIYITCHGHYAGGMSFFEFTDGSQLSARDLERELRRVKGRVIVLLDCCASGGAIYTEWTCGVEDAFADGPITGSKYRVICSAAQDQDSYRIALNESAQAGTMTTAFVRALCDGAGWSIDRGARGTMGADLNYDGSVSFAELALYLKARVSWYLQITSDLTGAEYAQDVQAIPEGDPLVLFKR